MVSGWQETEWTKEMESKSLDEINEELKNAKNIVSFLENLRQDKQKTEFLWKNKYIKIYGCNGEGPLYMKCKNCVLDRVTYSEPHIRFTGIGFCSEFGPYDDTNYVNFSTLDEHYLNYRFWQEKEFKRKAGNSTESSYDWNSYKVVEITKDEFTKEFDNMINKFNDTFYSWVGK